MNITCITYTEDNTKGLFSVEHYNQQGQVKLCSFRVVYNFQSETVEQIMVISCHKNVILSDIVMKFLFLRDWDSGLREGLEVCVDPARAENNERIKPQVESLKNFFYFYFQEIKSLAHIL